MYNTLSNKSSKLFIILAGFFITNTIIAELVGVKIFSLEQTLGFKPFNWSIFGVDDLGLNLTAGVILWPVVFIMTDIINEYFGKRGVKFLSYLTVGLIMYAFLMVFIAIHVSPNEWWQNISGQDNLNPANSLSNMNLAFAKIFGQGMNIIVASMVAFLIGQLLDAYCFQKLRKYTGEKKVWLRATGSTLISQLLDSYVVLIIAFYFLADWDLVRVLAIGSVNYLYKFFIAVILTPLIYLAHYSIDQYLGEEVASQLKQDAANN